MMPQRMILLLGEERLRVMIQQHPRLSVNSDNEATAIREPQDVLNEVINRRKPHDMIEENTEASEPQIRRGQRIRALRKNGQKRIFMPQRKSQWQKKKKKKSGLMFISNLLH